MSADRDHYRVLLRAGSVSGGQDLNAKECAELLALLENEAPKRRGNPHRSNNRRNERVGAQLLAMAMRGEVLTEEVVRAIAVREKCDKSTVYRARIRWGEKLRPIFVDLSRAERDRYVKSLSD